MTGKEKLLDDLRILERMVDEMDHYLRGNTLFGSALDDKLVQPTLGGYLVREHRLLALKEQLLGTVEQIRLETAIKRFNEVVAHQTVGFEEKAYREVNSRLQQWEQDLEELIKDPSPAYYRSDIEKRAIVTALINKLQPLPTHRKQEISKKLTQLDNLLRQHWVPGPFIWLPEWQSAYPKPEYWWLYGHIFSD